MTEQDDGRRISIEEVEREAWMWKPTPRLRWYRLPHCDDNNIVLQQLYERITGEMDWRPVQTILAD